MQLILPKNLTSSKFILSLGGWMHSIGTDTRTMLLKSKVIFVILLPGSSEIFKKCFYSIFELSHINNMRSFIVAIVYMHTVLFEQFHPLNYIEFGLSYSKWWSLIPFLFLQILFFFMAE
jgi:hypothetical protein